MEVDIEYGQVRPFVNPPNLVIDKKMEAMVNKSRDKLAFYEKRIPEDIDEDIEEEGDGLRGKLSGLNGGAYRTLSWRNSVSSNVVGSILMKDVDSRSWYDFPDNIAFSFSNL